MFATADRKAGGSPPAKPARADIDTYPQRRPLGRDSPRVSERTAEIRAVGLAAPPHTALGGSVPAQFRPCSTERAADRPRDFSGRDPAAGSGVMGDTAYLRTSEPRTRIHAHQARPRTSTRSICGSRWGNRLTTITEIWGEGTTTQSTSTTYTPVDGVR